MIYSIEKIKEINNFKDSIKSKSDYLLLTLGKMNFHLNNKNPQKFLMQGVCRRLKILTRSLENIFTLFPIEHKNKMTRDELSDLAIYIHAYFINIAGLFDNLG